MHRLATIDRRTTLVVERRVSDEGLSADVAHSIQQQSEVFRRQTLERATWNHIEHPMSHVLQKSKRQEWRRQKYKRTGPVYAAKIDAKW